MRIDVLVPDIPLPAAEGSRAAGRGAGFSALIDAAGKQLDAADRAEAAFAAGRGGLQEMVVERVRADIALQVAATGAQRAAQALGTLLGMQL